jgi:hypothetical protein
MPDFKSYRERQFPEFCPDARPYVAGEDITGIVVSDSDAAAGSPKEGDMIVRNSRNHSDVKLVAQEVFGVAYELNE